MVWVGSGYKKGLDNKCSALNCIYFLTLHFNICFGCSKNRLIKTVLLSAHNICLVKKQEN